MRGRTLSVALVVVLVALLWLGWWAAAMDWLQERAD